MGNNSPKWEIIIGRRLQSSFPHPVIQHSSPVKLKFCSWGRQASSTPGWVRSAGSVSRRRAMSFGKPMYGFGTQRSCYKQPKAYYTWEWQLRIRLNMYLGHHRPIQQHSHLAQFCRCYLGPYRPYRPNAFVRLREAYWKIWQEPYLNGLALWKVIRKIAIIRLYRNRLAYAFTPEVLID